MNPSKQKQTSKDAFDETLWTVGEETFESLAFMLLMPEDDDEPSQDTWEQLCRVNFTGPFGGAVFAAISPGMLEPLAANMLGIEPGEQAPEGVKLEDALKELLNVICGNLLPAIAGAEEVFHIASPDILDTVAIPETVDGMDQRGRAVMNLDSGRALLLLFIDVDADIPAAGGVADAAEPGGN